MKKYIFAAFLAVSAMSFVAPTQVVEAQGKKDKKTTKPKEKSYDFSADNIKGELVKPEGIDIDTRGWAQHSSLIAIRTNFIAEILKSAEDL